MKIFFSYPHDANAPFIERIKAGLVARGHEVWFDQSEIKSGDDWRSKITRGILDSQQVVAFLSRHAVRDPGVCLNEIAIALADKGEAIVTVLVEPESEVSAPVSITHIQWLSMEDWQTQAQDAGWYRMQLERLIDAIEHPSHAGRNGELETLRLVLDPMSFYAEIAPHIPRFTGRRWLIERYNTWLADEPNSRVLRIEGGPGLGKTALASYLAHSTKSSVLGVHLCQYNKGESRNPLRLVTTLAYQLASRLPDYRARLLKSVAVQHPKTMQGKDPASLWGEIISAPLAGGGKGNIDRQRLAIIIDGLDEATVEGKNPIVELLASEINRLPKWIGVVLTGRPDPELTQRLAHYQPFTISGDDARNCVDLQAYADAWMVDEVAAGTLTTAQAKQAASQLVDRSDGAFLYLTQARQAAGEGALDLKQPSAFPAGLGAIYLGFFERRFPDAQDDASMFARAVRPLLGYVLACPEPLALALARDLLGWKADDAGEMHCQRALLSLGSLLRHGKNEQGDATLAPFHLSVREWMQDGGRSGPFFVPTRSARAVLGRVYWQKCLLADRHHVDEFIVGTALYTAHRRLYDPARELLSSLDLEMLGRLLGSPEINADETFMAVSRKSDSLSLKRFAASRAKSMIDQHPADIRTALHYLKCQKLLASLLDKTGNKVEWRAEFERTVLFAESLFKRFPDSTAVLLGLTRSLNELAKQGDWTSQLPMQSTHFERVVELIKFEKIIGNDVSVNTALYRELYMAHQQLEIRYKQSGQTELSMRHALGWLYTANRIAKHVEQPFERDYALTQCIRAHNLISNLKYKDDLGGALKNLLMALKISKKLNPSPFLGYSVTRENISLYLRLGCIKSEQNRPFLSLRYYSKAIQLLANEIVVCGKLSKSTIHTLSSLLRLTEIEIGRYRTQQDAASVRDAGGRESKSQTNYERGKTEAVYIQVISELFGLLFHSLNKISLFLEARDRLTLVKHVVTLSQAADDAEEAQIVDCESKLGDLFRCLGHGAAAATWYQQAIEGWNRLIGVEPESTCFARNLSISHNKLGDLLNAGGETEAALCHFRRSLEIRERLARAAPENAQFVSELGISYQKLGKMQLKLGHTQAASESYQQAREIAERLAASAPENAEFARNLGISYNRLGDMQQALGNSQAALGLYQQALVIRDRLAASAPENAQFERDLSLSYGRLGDLQHALGNSQAALGLYQQALVIRERLAASAPKNAQFARDHWVIHWKCATITKGDEQTQSLRKVHSILIAMQKRGMFAKNDEMDLAMVKATLGLE